MVVGERPPERSHNVCGKWLSVVGERLPERSHNVCGKWLSVVGKQSPERSHNVCGKPGFQVICCELLNDDTTAGLSQFKVLS